MTRKNQFDYDDLISAGNGELFGPGFPKLPLPNMLMADRIVDVQETGGKYGKGVLKAELDIHPDLWFFKCHFIGDPVMPGCLGLDAMWQLVGFVLAWQGHKGKGRALGVGDVKFTGEVLPTNKLVAYTIDIKRIIARKLILAEADATVSVDGKEIYKATGLKVGLFGAEESA